MKIAMMIPSLKRGGAQKIAMDIAENNPDIFFVVIEKRVDNGMAKRIESSHKVYYLNKEPGFHPFIFWKINRILEKEKPDVVHFHLGVSLYGLIPCFFRPKIKLIYTFHTIAEKDTEGYIRRLCRVGIKIRKMLPVAITETVRDSIKEMYNLKDVKLIYNGIDTKKYDTAADRDDHTIHLAAIGQIWEAKNYLFMIDVIEQLVKTDTVTKYKLMILGDGPMKEEVRSKIKMSGLMKVVDLEGDVDHVQDYLARADIFILTSHYEGLSLATMEAMASSLPVISTNVGGMKDLIKDNGFLVEPGNKTEFVNKIILLARNSSLRRQMGLKSAAYVKKYEKKDMQENYMRFYQE
jgi:glycosyltransferase involved in cell wall biosynthesis